jgi:hypothetical protein
MALVLVASLATAILPASPAQAATTPMVSAGDYHTVGLKSDGHVVAVGENDDGQCGVTGWTDITQVSAGGEHTVGLKSDGHVVAVGSNIDGVTGWTDITQVSAGWWHTVGLKSDGTVVAVGSNIDGQCGVTGWTNITQVSAGRLHTVGLKSDGTVVAVGDNDDGQCGVTGWTDITQVSAGGYHTVGLKSDGTVVAVGDNIRCQCCVAGWTNLTQVSAGTYHTVGLKSDGTVCAVGWNNFGECNVTGWTNITQVSAGRWHTVGLKSDGTVVAVGLNTDGQCNVGPWSTSVTTEAATSITTDSATLNMSYNVGLYVPVDVRLAYKKSTSSTWSYTSWVSKSASGTHAEPLSGLDSNTQYDFKAQLKFDSTEIEGATLHFTTKTPPTVTTEAATGITNTSAILNMSYTLGSYNPVDVRFAYKKSTSSTWTYTSWVSKSASGTYAEPVTGLDPSTTYDFRAELKYDSTEIQGSTLQFTTKTPPTVTTEAATGITNTSAILNMSYTLGSYNPVDVRFVYKKSTDPTWTDNTTWVSKSASGTYAEPVTGLDPSTTYDFRAELEYDSTEIQGSTLQFTTKTPPTVTTSATTTITTTSAILNGNLDDLGTAASCNVTFEWGTTAGGPYPNETAPPETDNATGPFSFNLTGLAAGTTYYFRAKADGGIHGTSYGAELSFVTSGFSYTVPTATGTGTATFSTDLGNITGLTTSATTACGSLAGLDFPHGFFSFNVINIAPGSTVTITMTFPSAMPGDTQYWKCIDGQWVDATSILGDNDGDNILTSTITDGGPFDADGLANGTIVDPGGPAVPVAAASATPAGTRASPTPPRPLNPSQISLQYLGITPQQTSAGQPVTISTNVVNTGNEAGNYNIALKINGQLEQSRMVSIGPLGSQPVKFTVTKAQPGTYTVDIGGQKGSFIILGAGGTSGHVNGGMIALLIVGILVIVVSVLLILDFRRPSH